MGNAYRQSSDKIKHDNPGLHTLSVTLHRTTVVFIPRTTSHLEAGFEVFCGGILGGGFFVVLKLMRFTKLCRVLRYYGGAGLAGVTEAMYAEDRCNCNLKSERK